MDGSAFRGLDTFLWVGLVCMIIVAILGCVGTIYGLWWLFHHVRII